MALEHKRAAYFGNSFLGIFASTNNTHTLFPDEAPSTFVVRVCDALGTKEVRCSIGESNLNGVYAALNSKGIILPYFDRKVAEKIRKETGLEVYASRERMNAHGNNVSVNDKGGIINEHVGSAERRNMEDCLGVELVPMHIGPFTTVGSMCVATNKGFLVHYGATEEEIKALEGIFKVEGMKGTANTGTGFVGVCMLANDHGYIVGQATTAFEMGRVEEALGFLG